MAAVLLDQAHHGPMYDFGRLGFQKGEVAVVTGAGSGIGKATALTAAMAGLAVAVWDIDVHSARETEQAIAASGGTALAIDVDVADDAAISAAWNETSTLGICRYLVNNAGPASVSTLPFNEALAIAVGSVHRVTTGWLERFGTDARSVVSVASVAGNFIGSSSEDFYPSAKGAIAALTRHLAAKCRGNPRVNAVAPGFIVTPRTIPYLESEAMRNAVARIPAGRLGLPEDVASVICFLLSPAAAYVNGVLLPVDGGWIVSG